MQLALAVAVVSLNFDQNLCAERLSEVTSLKLITKTSQSIRKAGTHTSHNLVIRSRENWCEIVRVVTARWPSRILYVFRTQNIVDLELPYLPEPLFHQTSANLSVASSFSINRMIIIIVIVIVIIIIIFFFYILFSSVSLLFCFLCYCYLTFSALHEY